MDSDDYDEKVSYVETTTTPEVAAQDGFTFNKEDIFKNTMGVVLETLNEQTSRRNLTPNGCNDNQ
jgi:hypothetical protein